jgi:hypothetical protein
MDSWTIGMLTVLCLEALGPHVWINRTMPASDKVSFARDLSHAPPGRPPMPDFIPRRPYRATPTQKYKHAPTH